MEWTGHDLPYCRPMIGLRYGPRGVLGGWAFSYERGTPVMLGRGRRESEGLRGEMEWTGREGFVDLLSRTGSCPTQGPSSARRALRFSHAGPFESFPRAGPFECFRHAGPFERYSIQLGGLIKLTMRWCPLLKPFSPALVLPPRSARDWSPLHPLEARKRRTVTLNV